MIWFDSKKLRQQATAPELLFKKLIFDEWYQSQLSQQRNTLYWLFLTFRKDNLDNIRLSSYYPFHHFSQRVAETHIQQNIKNNFTMFCNTDFSSRRTIICFTCWDFNEGNHLPSSPLGSCVNCVRCRREEKKRKRKAAESEAGGTFSKKHHLSNWCCFMIKWRLPNSQHQRSSLLWNWQIVRFGFSLSPPLNIINHDFKLLFPTPSYLLSDKTDI